MSLPKNHKLTARSQFLRKNATKAEQHLWYDFLKNYPLQFNRQKVIGNFIVDFYCEKIKLAIELDGSQHYKDDAQIYDSERSAYLNGLDIAVIRFSNLDIQKNFNGVCLEIHRKICELSE
jgi:very-short-patch-repair endonuclease